ncbi:cAMP-binding protein [Labilithrix luteola]|uniref:cAMP-binding protein n=1 Tax=Labilithrix luteola TaxID=1391654 RepID=A0A0K1QEQ1_9BACT|nr:cyclic nucleotide-binding domain-containing protein [Labilithrix luteola]AKV04236.1 cAMP-binding protein [Labilithrix luteola]
MRAAPPDLPGAQTSDSPLDRALALLLAGEREAALRWSAAVVQREPSSPSALILTSRLLAEAGRTEAAVEGFELGVACAIDAGNLPLAVAAVGDLQNLGVDVSRRLDEIAGAFCAGSSRLSDEDAPPPPLPNDSDFQPLSSFLSGPALLSKSTGIIHDASKDREQNDDSATALVSPLPLFSALEKEGLRALIGCFEMMTVPAGHSVIAEGEAGAEAYIVARGELEVRRTTEDGRTLTLARLANGALFGEMALLSRAPRSASVVACRPSIILVARRDALEGVAEKRPDVGVELAAHCRRRMVANLVRTSKVLLAVAAQQRPALVERFETKVFEKGQKLIEDGKDTSGLHLIASGEVAVVGREEGGETFVIATLGVGETVGEVALVLRRKANADVVAVHPTVTLHLPREDFVDLVRAHPAILAGLYLVAVERDEETSSVLAGSTTTAAAEDYILV